MTCVLDDGVNVNIIKRRGEDGGDVRERLRRMMSGRTASDGTGGDDAEDEDDEKDDDVRGPPPTGADATEAAARLKTKRTARWLRETAPRVESVLAAALTPLCAHRKPSVRRGGPRRGDGGDADVRGHPPRGDEDAAGVRVGRSR